MVNFDKVISRYGTYSTQWDYIQDRFGEKNLLPFSISDMDFELPEGTKEVLIQSAERGLFGYTRWNHEDFKEAITGWFARQFQTKLERESIVYSPSVIYSLSVLIQLLSQSQGKIVTFTPCYDAFFQTISENDRRLIGFSLKKEQNKFSIDFEELSLLFEREKPEIFLLCNPHNPTGRAFTELELVKMISLCNQYHVAIISDEIHMDIRRVGIKHIPILKLSSQIKVPVVLLSSASKTFNSPGLGCSYGMIPNRELREAYLAILKRRDGLSSAAYMGLLALQDCYNNQEEWLRNLNKYIDGNFQMVKQKLQDAPYISFDIPEATYLAWIELTGLPVSMDQLQSVLVHEEKVAIMRGDAYGIEGAHYLRLNLGAPREKVEEGINRLLRGIEKATNERIEK